MISPAHDEALRTFSERFLESSRFHMGKGAVYETLETLAADLAQAGIDYAILGGMALNAHGYKRETVDVDVLLRPEGLQAFRDRFVGRGYLEAFAGARKTFKNTRTNTKVEFISTGEYPGDGKPKAVAFPDPATVSVEIHGARYVNLATLVELKLASGMTNPGRLKDLADVQELIRELKLDETFATALEPFVRDKYLELRRGIEAPDPYREDRSADAPP